MKRGLLILIVVALLVPLCFGDCPDQVFLDYSTSPYEIDSNELAIDPVTNTTLYLGAVEVEVGLPWEWMGWGCDPEGDPFTFASEATLVVEGNEYMMSGVMTTIGLQYYDISVTDHPATTVDPNQPRTRTGTVVVVGLPVNQPPVLCGGQP